MGIRSIAVHMQECEQGRVREINKMRNIIIMRVELNTQPSYYITVASIEQQQLHLIICTDCVCMFVFTNIIIAALCQQCQLFSLSLSVCVLSLLIQFIYKSGYGASLRVVATCAWTATRVCVCARVCVCVCVCVVFGNILVNISQDIKFLKTNKHVWLCVSVFVSVCVCVY